MTKTLAALIAAHPDDAQALGAPGRAWLNYSGLRSLAADVAQTLHRAGIGRGDRVAGWQHAMMKELTWGVKVAA